MKEVPLHLSRKEIHSYSWSAPSGGHFYKDWARMGITGGWVGACPFQWCEKLTATTGREHCAYS